MCSSLFVHRVESPILETKTFGLKNYPPVFFTTVEQILGEE